MSDAEVFLRPMTRAEFDAWLPRPAQYFHGGFKTPGQFVFRIMAGEVPVGWLWLSVPGPNPDPLMAWVLQIEIEAAFRGRGYGRSAMRLAEQEARAHGMTSLGLNVHGQNTVARSLYESLGYEVATLQMKKLV